MVGPVSNSGAGGVTGVRSGIRYPGVSRMFLIWTVIGALAVVRYQLPLASPGHTRESLS